MRAFLIPGLILLHIGLMVYSIADLLRTDQSRLRGLPRLVWALVIIVIPIAGSLFWILRGKEPLPPSSFGPRPQQRRRGPVAPDDDIAFLGKLDRERDRDRERDERIRDLEEQLKGGGEAADDAPDGTSDDAPDDRPDAPATPPADRD